MDLVVLAAGMGSRFGGLKQLQPIDNENNFIVDYSAFDAIRAGFDRIIFVIKQENFYDFDSTIGQRLKQYIPVEYAFQSLDKIPQGTVIPQGRIKPWGTAHALYCCKDIVSDKFAVINADDFYGYESFKIVADFLRHSNNPNQFVNAGYLVKNTLTKNGSVKRAVFNISDNKAQRLVESEIVKKEEKIYARPLEMQKWFHINENTLVSMSFFGFTKKLIDKINVDIIDFFKKPEHLLEKDEFLLPDVINNMIKNKEISLQVIPTPAQWHGITYKEDLQDFKASIEDLKKNGDYPHSLYQSNENV